MRKVMAVSGFLIFLVFCCFPAFGLNGVPLQLPYDFSDEFVTMVHRPLESFELGGVSLEQQDRYEDRPTLLMDCGRVSDRVVVASFALPKHLVNSLKGKRLLFRTHIKWLRGEGRLKMRMRCFSETAFLVDHRNVYFEGERGAWQPYECQGVIPPIDEVKRVDIIMSLENTPKPAALLVGKAVLSEATEQVRSFQSDMTVLRGGIDNAPLTIVDKGKPTGTIITSAKPTKTEAYAVRELLEHIELCTGAVLPVVSDSEEVSGPTIHVGSTALSRSLGLAPSFLPPDNWMVWRVGQSLESVGRW